MSFFFNDTATTEIYTYLTHSFPTRRSSDLLTAGLDSCVRRSRARPGSALAALGAVEQFLVGQHQRHHRFDHRHAANADAGVVAALGHDVRRLALAGDGFARDQDRAGRLDGDADLDDRKSVVTGKSG